MNSENNDQYSDDTLNLLKSLSFVRAKINGHELGLDEIQKIIEDVLAGRYLDIHTAAFLTACAGGRLSEQEIVYLTKSMIQVGDQLSWSQKIIVDKHCVGGLPGNRTSLIIVPIVTAFGLTMPKTSSRAITSPAGTADTMETIAPVNLDLKSMQRVVENEGGCIVWGGAVSLSPADDALIRIERAMGLDGEGQLIASVLSKKIAAGSTHILIDIPIGPTAKIRSEKIGVSLKKMFMDVSKAFNVNLNILMTDGSQPIGRGIGPALEAKDVLAVLKNEPNAPKDLRDRALMLAGHILEFSPVVAKGHGINMARELLTSGKAWQKFQAICHAQGGFDEPPTAAFTYTIESPSRGRVISIDNQKINRLAKLAGAPHDKAAGIFLETPLDTIVESHQPLFTIHSDSQEALKRALSLLEKTPNIIQIENFK